MVVEVMVTMLEVEVLEVIEPLVMVLLLYKVVH